jgi:hypothetical protein
MLNIVCLKWGTKYGPEYVNRLYSMCKKFYTNDFKFYCATDDSNEIISDVNILDLSLFQTTDGKWGGKVFTSEKINLINYFDEKTLLLDLDILILNDITEFVDSIELKDKTYFIRNAWANQDNIKRYYGAITCDVNSSFVIGNKASSYILRTLLFNKDYDYYALKYRSLDKTLFYRFQNYIKFYEDKKLVYSFNGGASWPDDMEIGKYRSDYKVCLFNNSHGTGDDIHECDTTWAIEYWESFDD